MLNHIKISFKKAFENSFGMKMKLNPIGKMFIYPIMCGFFPVAFGIELCFDHTES